MIQPGRKYSIGSSKYRYGFNGQEKENELNENITTAEFWEYDSRIGRRWNIDPIYKHSPYECFGSNPIWFTDKNGADSTVYIFSHSGKVKSSLDGPGKKIAEKILKNVQTIFEANGIKNLKYKTIDESDFLSGKIKLDATDAIVGIIGSNGGRSEGGSYISPNGIISPGLEGSDYFRFPYYSFSAGSDHASVSSSDNTTATSFGVAHEILHQYIMKADKVFYGYKAPSGDHYDETINLNATGYKLGTYLRTHQINSKTILQHTTENTIGYITRWQRIYITGYFRALSNGVDNDGKDAGKESSWKYIFQSSGWMFKTQLDGLNNFRSSMVEDRPASNN